MKLVAAVAPQRVENISGHALGMDADDGSAATDIAKNQCQRSFRLPQLHLRFWMLALEGEQAKGSPAGREMDLRDLS
jgi:hypothetical protein